MAGPVQIYSTTQAATQEAFTGPFGLLGYVNAAISAAQNKGAFNATVDCSPFNASDVSALGVYLRSLGYHLDVASNGGNSLTVDWGEFYGPLIAQTGLVSPFARMLNGDFYENEEILADKPLDWLATFEYVGMALQGSERSAAVWFIIRRTWVNNRCVRMQFRSGMSWDDRTSGWN